jgi:hypothetical protein
VGAAAPGGTVGSGGSRANGGSAGLGAAGGSAGFVTGGSAGFVTGGSAGLAAGGSLANGGSPGLGGSAGAIGGSGGSATGGAPAGGTTGGASAGAVAFAQVMTFIRVQCGTCHTGQTPPNLNTTRGAEMLHRTLTTTPVAECGGHPLVTAGEPKQSALLMVGMGECGMLRMPAGCVDPICYSVADELLLTSWILAGARNP